jgi:hypothetical protein
VAPESLASSHVSTITMPVSDRFLSESERKAFPGFEGGGGLYWTLIERSRGGPDCIGLERWGTKV